MSTKKKKIMNMVFTWKKINLTNQENPPKTIEIIIDNKSLVSNESGC